MKKLLITAAIGFAVFILAALAVLYTPSLERQTVEGRYAAVDSSFVTLADGTRAHVRITGPDDAPPVVLLHGSNANLFTWNAWSSRLDGVLIVTMDLPAHGLTGATPSGDYSRAGAVDFVAQVIDKLSLGRVVIGGNSRGGAVAAAFAARFPDRVAGLLLVDAAGIYGRTPQVEPGDGDQSLPLAFRLARMPVIKHVITRLTPRWLVADGLRAAVADTAVITEAKIDLYWDTLRMEGSRLATLERFSLPAPEEVNTDALTMPVLIQWGEKDTFIPVSLAHDWHARLRDSRLAIYPQAGHLPMIEVPEKSAADVAAFLRDIGWWSDWRADQR